MRDIAAKPGGRHYVLWIAGGLAFLSAAALLATVPFLLADPEAGIVAAVWAVGLALIDLAISWLLLVRRSRPAPIPAVVISLLALVGAVVPAGWLGLMELETGFAVATTQGLLFFAAFVANALIFMFAVLELVFGRQGQGASTSKPGVA